MSEQGDRLRKPSAPAADADQQIGEQPRTPVEMARMQRAVMRKKAAATVSATPGADKLQTACAKDPMAAHKLGDIMQEKAPRAVEKRHGFVENVAKKLDADPAAKALQVLRDEGAKQEYLCLGEPLKKDALAKAEGVSRVLDLPSLFKNDYLAPAYLSAFAPKDQAAFIEQVEQNKFDPMKHLNNGKDLRGKVGETWWFPSNGASKVDLNKLRHELYIHEEPAYTHGAVRLDMPPEELAAQKIELYKPTAFDGLHQGWGDDPWWRASNDPDWGLTKNSTKEAVMPSTRVEKFTHRRLMMPTQETKKDAPHDADKHPGATTVDAKHPDTAKQAGHKA